MTDDGKTPFAPELLPVHVHAPHRASGQFTIGVGNSDAVAARLAAPAIVPRAIRDRCPRCGHGPHNGHCDTVFNGKPCAMCAGGSVQPSAKGSEP